MKVVFINAVYEISSTGRTYKELHDYLWSQGHECFIIYGNHKGKYKDSVYVGNFFDHKIHALFSRLTGKVGGYSYFYTKKVISFLNMYKPDIVHLGNLHGNFINIPMLLEYLKESNIATSLTLHDCFFFTGGCVHYVSKNCFAWQKKCIKCLYYRENGSWFFDKSSYQFNYKQKTFQSMEKLGVIGVSDWIKSEAMISPIFQNTKIIRRIYNWIDLTVFKPNDSGIEIKKNLGIEEKFVILGVANSWGEEKGLDIFLNIAKKIDNNYVIIMVGKMSCVNSLPDNIISIPATTNVSELVDYYNAADVFVQLSKQETFGKVVAEALACGTPAIVYNSTASPELIQEGCGYSIDIEDEGKMIVEKIEAVKKLGKSYFSLNCRQKAIRNFDKNANCQKYVEFWKDLLS